MAGFAPVPRPSIPAMEPVVPDISAGIVTGTDVDGDVTPRSVATRIQHLVNHVAGIGAASPAINVKCAPFNAKGDGTTDDTAAAQAAYDAAAVAGGAEVIWPNATYRIDGTVYFASNTRTDLGGSTIQANGQIPFCTGYLSGGVVVSNLGTTNQVERSTIGNGVIRNASAGLRLHRFIYNCHAHDLVFRDCANNVHGTNCYYSNYSHLIRLESVDTAPQRGVAGVTLGSPVITVPNVNADPSYNSDATTLRVGMTIGASFVPYGATVTIIGAADSGGAGLTNVTLSENATLTAVAGANLSGYAATDNLEPVYRFRDECSNLSFDKCSASSRFIGWELHDVASSKWTGPDAEWLTYAFRLSGACLGNEWSNIHTENILQWIWDWSENNDVSGGPPESLAIMGVSNYARVAGVITAGATGYVNGTLVLPYPGAATAYTPFGGYAGGLSYLEPRVDLSSPNARLFVIGGSYGFAYARGDFTPTVEGVTSAGACTYDSQIGKYTRVGDLVRFRLDVQWHGHTGTGTLRIGGLPLIAGNATALQFYGFPAVPFDLTFTAGSQVVGFIGGGTWTNIDVYQVEPAGVQTAIAVPAAGRILISGSYEV